MSQLNGHSNIIKYADKTRALNFVLFSVLFVAQQADVNVFCILDIYDDDELGRKFFYFLSWFHLMNTMGSCR